MWNYSVFHFQKRYFLDLLLSAFPPNYGYEFSNDCITFSLKSQKGIKSSMKCTCGSGKRHSLSF